MNTLKRIQTRKVKIHVFYRNIKTWISVLLKKERIFYMPKKEVFKIFFAYKIVQKMFFFENKENPKTYSFDNLFIRWCFYYKGRRKCLLRFKISKILNSRQLQRSKIILKTFLRCFMFSLL